MQPQITSLCVINDLSMDPLVALSGIAYFFLRASKIFVDDVMLQCCGFDFECIWFRLAGFRDISWYLSTVMMTLNKTLSYYQPTNRQFTKSAPVFICSVFCNRCNIPNLPTATQSIWDRRLKSSYQYVFLEQTKVLISLCDYCTKSTFYPLSNVVY